MPGTRVTLHDVAVLAGVSRSTVSKVLNGGGRVSPETRERIQEAARRLDFQPNALARSFATGRSLTIGVLARNALGTFSMPVLTGANRALGSGELASLLYDTALGRMDDPALIRKLQSRQIDGLLVVGEGLGAPLVSVTEHFEVPVVYAFGFSADPDDTSVLPDGRAAGRMAAQHLLDIGRTRIAHITCRGDRAADERAAGLAEVLEENGLPLALGAPLSGDWSRAWGARAAQRILDSGEEVDAIFCGDDWIALGAQSVLRAAGRRIPEDIALVGVDNLWWLLGRQGGYLTTVDPRLADLGGLAARHLVDRIAGAPAVPGTIAQECSLVLGASTTGDLSRTAGDADPLWRL